MRILLATNNKNKLIELSRILGEFGMSVVSPQDVGIEVSVPETGKTFAANAHLKARAFFEASGLPSLADDSGLCIDSLDGQPGVDSAVYLGEGASYPERFAAIFEGMKDIPDERRTARFVSALCLVIDEERVATAMGICEGRIGQAPIGEGGFGYDPIFYIGERSFAQMDSAEKDSLSHRGKAIRQLVEIMEGGI